jgi:hypothetical protein
MLAKAIGINDSKPPNDLVDSSKEEEQEEKEEEDGDDSQAELDLENLEEVKEAADYGEEEEEAEESAQQMSSSSSQSAADVGSYSLSDMASLAVLAFDSVSQHCLDTEMPPHMNLQALQTFVSGEHGQPASGSKPRGQAPPRGKKGRSPSCCNLRQLQMISLLREEH